MRPEALESSTPDQREEEEEEETMQQTETARPAFKTDAKTFLG